MSRDSERADGRSTPTSDKPRAASSHRPPNRPGPSSSSSSSAPGSLLEAGVRTSPAFLGGLALGAGLSFLALLALATSPWSPFLHPDFLLSSSASGGGGGGASRRADSANAVYPRANWGPWARAYHAEALISQVRQHAPEEIRERCVSIIRGEPGSLHESFSQASQDWLLFHNFFFHTPYGKGSYIDIGSNHPRELSNTYFFDKCLGWRGVCIEPNPEYHPLYEELNRTCTLVKKCVADREATMRMTLRKGLHGRIGEQGKEVECRTLHSIVEEHRLSYAEFATIDIEGAEWATLRCFPFRAHHIATWLVETDKAGLDLFRLFVRGGYAYVGDILCPLRVLHSQVTRVGVKLDSVFRLVSPSFILGPSFLPGKKVYGLGARGPCRAWSKGEEACPEQVPVVEVEEVHRENMTLKDDVCPVSPLAGSRPEFVLPTQEHPAIYRG